MFAVSVVDHVRLNFGHVVQNYTIHASASERLASLALKARITVLALLAAAMGSTILGFLHQTRGYQIAALVCVVVAFTGHAAYVATGVESRLFNHRLLAHRLWLMCERYRSLLSEIQDGLLSEAALVERRESLIQDLHAIYEQGFSVDQPAFETKRQMPVSAGGFNEQQIDDFLPPSARRGAELRSAGLPVSH